MPRRTFGFGGAVFFKYSYQGTMEILSAKDIGTFQKTIWKYYREHGRDLPWRRTVDPYRILVSEFMLQQTQVERVIPKYRAFVKEFPNFAALDRAPLAGVLKAWQGLGYNRRALMLKKLAAMVITDYQGKLPTDPRLLNDLPGIGPGTAGALCAFVFGIPVPFIETNIRRAYLHHFFPKKKNVLDANVLDLVEETLDAKNPREWYYALMDYGAMLGRKEKENPNRRSRHYAKQSRFKGSDRQVRGQILRLLLARKNLSLKNILKELEQPEIRIVAILAGLEREGFIKKVRNLYGVLT
ncbi:MAG: A/G-specific adenine glycosylase [Candidatus Sungbacteria bacterium]|nr:A/G-specific adenine glycosylase [Candidatus Sungbacteria bacterium]